MARNKNPEITINRILDAAMDLFLEKGYDNTTIQDIVDAHRRHRRRRKHKVAARALQHDQLPHRRPRQHLFPPRE